ncbi:MAG: VOC family protein [Bacteroidales bacterium]|nr:VOC family protein [Bacteroidales bacterium]
MKKLSTAAAAALIALAGCAPAPQNELVNPDGFVIEHFALDVADPDATAAWWCENLGFTVTKKKDDAAHTIFIVDASGRMALEVYRAQTQPVAPDYAAMDPLTLHFGFTSKDVDADIERLTKAGATLVVHEKAPGFDGAMMKDPFGIAIQFVKREQSVLLK